MTRERILYQDGQSAGFHTWEFLLILFPYTFVGIIHNIKTKNHGKRI